MAQFCGVDIIEVNRVKEAILNTQGFKERVFTKKEIEVGDNKSDAVKYQYYAGRFAAKEAVYKALSSKFDDKLWLGDIEILNDSKLLNRPYVVLKNTDLESMQKQGTLEIDVSVSHIEALAIASSTVSIH